MGVYFVAIYRYHGIATLVYSFEIYRYIGYRYIYTGTYTGTPRPRSVPAAGYPDLLPIAILEYSEYPDFCRAREEAATAHRLRVDADEPECVGRAFRGAAAVREEARPHLPGYTCTEKVRRRPPRWARRSWTGWTGASRSVGTGSLPRARRSCS